MNKTNKILMILVLLFVYAVFTKTVFSFFYADYVHKEGREELFAGNITKSSQKVGKAVRLNPNEPFYHRSKATVYLAATIIEGVSDEDKMVLKARALEELEKAFGLQKNNLVNVKNLIPLYLFLALDDSNNLENATVDRGYVNHAIKMYTEVENISPNDSSTYLSLGKNYRLLKERDKAREMLEKALMLKPDLTSAKEQLELLETFEN